MYRSNRAVTAVKRVSKRFRTCFNRGLKGSFSQRAYMPSERCGRLLLLVGLTVVGVGLAGIGTAFGAGNAVQRPGAEFVVADGNLSVAQADQSRTVVTNLSHVSEVRIDRTNTTQYTVDTRERRPLSPAERERARTVALDNRTVREAVEGIPSAELTVEPVRGVNASVVNAQAVNSTGEMAGSDTFTVSLNETGETDGSVMIGRHTSSVENRAVVNIRDTTETPPEDLQYTVRIDTANGTVTDITDWERVRENGSIVDVSTLSNTSSTDSE